MLTVTDYGMKRRYNELNSGLDNGKCEITVYYVRRFTRFGTSCTILKNMKNLYGGVIL